MNRSPTLSAPASLFPPRRAIVLGASNVIRSLPTIVQAARRSWGSPLDLLVACGHGRSYGMRMALLSRELPGILECGLWEALASRPPAPTAALLTDIGNDLLYEVSVSDVAGWVEACLDRLSALGARIVLTPLPLHSIAALPPWRYRLLRTILFPLSRLSHADALTRVRELDARVRNLARERGASLVEQRPEWYGFDPIHVRSRYSTAAWRERLAPWAEIVPAPFSPPRWLGEHLRLLPPERRWLFGREQVHPQPGARLPDGTTLSLY